jgi:hypothetical protein
MSETPIGARRSPETPFDDSREPDREPDDDRRRLVRLLARLLAQVWLDAQDIDPASPPSPTPAPLDP